MVVLAGEGGGGDEAPDCALKGLLVAPDLGRAARSLTSKHRPIEPEWEGMADQRGAAGAGTRRKYDLEQRLMEFSARIIWLTEGMTKSEAGRHVAGQLLRSGTCPYGNHGEAEDAESRNDFVHKLKLCLKELRETWRWLRLVRHLPLTSRIEEVDALLNEADQLIRIFRQSVITAQKPR